MAVKIRLRRAGKRNAACHRIVVADGRSPRDGRFIEIIGSYDPRNKAENVDLDRAEYWLANGAQASETVAAIIKRARAGVPMRPAAEPPAEASAPPRQTAPAEAAGADAEDSDSES
ncbi:MAG: 30S ribosomal protein S16 [Lentisphaeria bacterium]|nr:30S ribosomal protein S16 [Lentisphaeria bacterium]